MAPTPRATAPGPDVTAAGAVVTRKGAEGREVLLVHRPKYDDWSFPKGKQDPGEHVTETAVREILEETGVEIRLGRPLRPQAYVVSGGRSKVVHYWVGHVVGEDDVSAYAPNAEVDDLGWFTPDEAAERLTYLDDLALLEQFRAQSRPTSTLVLLRHAKARNRGTWEGPDPLRTLSEVGRRQAAAVVPVLLAYGTARVVSSTSTRCLQTVQPYAEEQVLPIVEVADLSEEGYDEPRVRALLADLATTPEPTVVCTHRPLLPMLFKILDLEQEPLQPSEMLVYHHRKGELVATERHLVMAAE